MTPPSPAEQTRQPVTPMSVEPEAAALQVAGPAPMFSFIGSDGRWHRSDELLAKGPILVMFGASHDDLVAVQKLSAAFDELGVRPVAVLDVPTRSAAALTRKLGLTTALVTDPMSAIGGLYHSLDPATGQHAPAYFVIDARRTLRAMYFGPLPPAELLVASAARCLGRPLPTSVFTGADER